ncbi:OmpA family protein [Moheibacter stercoris]|uniref:Outer membrane protein OmpA-like peptidoglycan-associated protein n=1 Tax=Moheibacter stercoris TaxID=1628251 RepID=A0ABV2LUA5_9FLAO
MKLNKGILAVLVGSTLFLTACKCEKNPNMATAPVAETENVGAAETTVAKIDADGNYIYDLGNNIDINLPDGSKMNVGENSSENKLFTMLNDTNFAVSDDKTQGWVTLDRVYFPTGKADLSTNSDAQVANLVTLLKLFPTATVKVGGYTDSTGDAAVNKQVSTDRAKSVADKIIAGGIDASRIESEGYGAQHFVCEANDTDECKAQNRRVDIRITKK